jgi:hypothetical protein
MSFYLSLVTYEYHRVHPKWFLNLWYIWCKPCNYLGRTLTPPSNGQKQDSTWPTSPRSCIEYVQTEPMVRLAQTVHLSCVKIGTISKQTEMSFHLSLINLESTRCIQNDFLTLWYIWHKHCTYLPLTLTPSWNRPKRDSTWATSPRCSIGFVQNDFQAYHTFGANHAPILLRH